jgi:hypothetical protein
MNSDWLAASNFERMHEVASAINTLSIHAKLELAHVPNPTPESEIEKARNLLLDFIARLRGVLDEVERGRNGTVVGTDPRLNELALQFLGGRASHERRGSQSQLPLTVIQDLVESERPEDLRCLIVYLQELRTVIEEQTHPDIVGILGDL